MGEIPEGTTRFDYEYDLEKPEHSLEFVTSPDGFHAKHSIISRRVHRRKLIW
jgi:hypothetical protein